MTQRKNARNEYRSWHRSLGAQSLCWLSSISFLSSGFVLAQTESAIDNIVPIAENTQKFQSENAPKVTIERNLTRPKRESSSQTEFSSRRARLRERLRRNVAQQPTQQSNGERAPRVRLRRSSEQASEPVRQRLRQSRNESAQDTPVVRKLRPKYAESQRDQVVPEVRIRRNPIETTSQPRETNRENKPQIPSKLPEVSRNSKPVNSNETADKPKDYNNAYIDPTDYSTPNTAKYESPDTVVLTERSSGCRSVLGSGSMRGGCVKAPVTASDPERTSKPSWIRKSQNINVASAVSTQRPARNTGNTRNTENTESKASWRNSRIVAAINVRNSNNGSSENNRNNVNVVNVTRSARTPLSAPAVVMSSNKNTYHPNRFIPAPSNFAPPVTSLGATPSGGALPLPVNAANVAPRASTVAYNIPLESTLPRVAYSGSTVAYNPNGLIFPLSVPASITSLFGWRTHPITGNVRFHSGTDLGAAMGTPVIAAFTGQVEVADFVGGYGLTVILNHNSAVQTLYAHMSQLYVQPGQWVQQGMVIGLVGSTGNSTGPHLHFEVRQLTPEGWVATDPSVHLQYALSQLMQSFQTAQAPQQPSN